MYVIIGTIIDYHQTVIGGSFEEFEKTEKIATFDTKEAAEEYIKKSKLKTPKRAFFSSEKPFKMKSLLWECTYAEIEEYNEPPHNPQISW